MVCIPRKEATSNERLGDLLDKCVREHPDNDAIVFYDRDFRLSRALGQRVGTFMDDQYLPDPIITRRGSLHEETDSARGAKGHYHYFPLGTGKTDRHMEPLYITIGVDEEKEMSSHEGEEFMAVISGKILIRYGTMEQVLEQGDTVYYNSVVPHFVGAVDGPAEILAVLYVPN